MKKITIAIGILFSLMTLFSCSQGGAGVGGTIADYRVAKESVLRSIPDQYIDDARESIHIAYNHTSHGTHVAFGVFGLPDYKSGDDTLFAVSTSQETGSLEFLDNGIPGTYSDLSVADLGGWSGWLNQNRNFLDDPDNARINVIMWSWCDITGHNIDTYLSLMQTLIDEYGHNGTKIGTGSGSTRTGAVDFIFMTGHANPNSNTGTGNPKAQAQKIVDYCASHGYYCIDYYSIDTHTMDDVYYEDTGDNGNSDDYVTAYNASHADESSGSFYADWQNANINDSDWFYSKSSPGGGNAVGQHNESPENYITANRKAYAFWWVLAKLSGWQG